jgi:hypothetical protein
MSIKSFRVTGYQYRIALPKRKTREDGCLRSNFFRRSCFDCGLFDRSFLNRSDLFRRNFNRSFFCRGLSGCFRSDFSNRCCRCFLNDRSSDWVGLHRKDVLLLSFEYALRDKEVHKGWRNLCTLSDPVLDALWLERYGLSLRIISTHEVYILAGLWARSFLKHEHTVRRVILAANALESDHQHSEANDTR